MTPSLPFLLGTADLPLAELHAARLDGELVAIAGRFSPVDIAHTVDPAGARQLRARAVGPLVPPALVVERRTAAWLHGAWPVLPSPIELCVRSDHRVRVRAGPAAAARTIRQAVLRRDELLRVEGVFVTTPIRTAIDLLRLPVAFGRATRQAVTTLLLMQEDGLEVCALALQRASHLPHKQRAIDRLGELAGGAD